MQRIFSAVKTLSSISTALKNKNLNVFSSNARILTSYFSTIQNVRNENRLLQAFIPIVNPVCTFKLKGRVRRRCKSCYFVMRDGRMHVICKEHPRHKQMAMRPKPHNTWILTQASQSKVRPW